jgi:hypothetical protein
MVFLGSILNPLETPLFCTGVTSFPFPEEKSTFGEEWKMMVCPSSEKLNSGVKMKDKACN